MQFRNRYLMIAKNEGRELARDLRRCSATRCSRSAMSCCASATSWAPTGTPGGACRPRGAAGARSRAGGWPVACATGCRPGVEPQVEISFSTAST